MCRSSYVYKVNCFDEQEALNLLRFDKQQSSNKKKGYIFVGNKINAGYPSTENWQAPDSLLRTHPVWSTLRLRHMEQWPCYENEAQVSGSHLYDWYTTHRLKETNSQTTQSQLLRYRQVHNLEGYFCPSIKEMS